MATYISLCKLNREGIEGAKDLPSGIEEACTQYESMGGGVLGVCAVVGEYDFAAAGQAPRDGAQMTCGLSLGAGGNARPRTLRTCSKEEFAKIVRKLR
jgi:uncharacterized protein with GYD domain